MLRNDVRIEEVRTIIRHTHAGKLREFDLNGEKLKIISFSLRLPPIVKTKQHNHQTFITA
jgi:hypothetical protein